MPMMTGGVTVGSTQTGTLTVEVDLDEGTVTITMPGSREEHGGISNTFRRSSRPARGGSARHGNVFG